MDRLRVDERGDLVVLLVPRPLGVRRALAVELLPLPLLDLLRHDEPALEDEQPHHGHHHDGRRDAERPRRAEVRVHVRDEHGAHAARQAARPRHEPHPDALQQRARQRAPRGVSWAAYPAGRRRGETQAARGEPRLQLRCIYCRISI
ncbi:hypothetical protein FOCC_FOCC017234, partial [Frankliniella occidentalis]